MRELKFRAWNEGKMIYSPRENNFGLGGFFEYIKEDAIIMQFTGVRDRNGVMIFEGDIIKNTNSGLNGTVRYEEYSFTTTSLEDEYDFESVLDYQEELIEVIGNIYENNSAESENEITVDDDDTLDELIYKYGELKLITHLSTLALGKEKIIESHLKYIKEN